MTDWSIVISDIASPADEAVLRDAIDEFNLAAMEPSRTAMRPSSEPKHGTTDNDRLLGPVRLVQTWKHFGRAIEL